MMMNIDDIGEDDEDKDVDDGKFEDGNGDQYGNDDDDNDDFLVTILLGAHSILPTETLNFIGFLINKNVLICFSLSLYSLSK